MTRIFALLLALVFAMSPQAHAADAASPDDTARVLAGMAPSDGSALVPFTKEASWQSHAKYFDKAWADLDKRQLGKIRSWAKSHVPQRKPVVFYMFSGPDYLYADAFLDGAETFILAGLEPVGIVPDLVGLPPKALGQELRELQGSLNSVLSYSFFITKKMRTQLNNGRLSGTLPVLYTFLARAGKTVKSASLVWVLPDGKLGTAAEAGASPGAKIEFQAGPEGKLQTLYYFSTDISNGGLKKSGFLTFLKGYGQGDSFVKSASYLMHADSFSDIRAFLVDNSATLIQDDSGVPVRFLDEAKWTLKPFGRYLQPLGIFPNTYQKQLAQLYGKDKAEKLDFGVGYRWRPNESNLLLATRK